MPARAHTHIHTVNESCLIFILIKIVINFAILFNYSLQAVPAETTISGGGGGVQ